MKADQWSQWLLDRRFGGDKNQMKTTMAYLAPVRDKVLENANLAEDEILLDVGSGDGLIAFGALEKIPSSTVIFSDISQDLLAHSRSAAQAMGVIARCQFLKAAAEDLSALADESVDAVTTRSVLIYVTAKQQAFSEFYRVLKPGGRMSIFEPINRFSQPAPEHTFFGYDVTPEIELAKKVKAVYRRHKPPDADPMLDFDEYDLIIFSERAGFAEIHLELQAEIKPTRMVQDFDAALRMAPNPLAPTLGEAIREALTPEEARRFEAFLRKLVAEEEAIRKSAAAYVWAVK